MKSTLYSRNAFIFSNSHRHRGWPVLLYPFHRPAKSQEHTAGQWQGWSSSPSLLILDHCIILPPNPVAVSPEPTLGSPDAQTMPQASHGELLGLEPPQHMLMLPRGFQGEPKIENHSPTLSPPSPFTDVLASSEFHFTLFLLSITQSFT